MSNIEKLKLIAQLKSQRQKKLAQLTQLNKAKESQLNQSNKLSVPDEFKKKIQELNARDRNGYFGKITNFFNEFTRGQAQNIDVKQRLNAGQKSLHQVLEAMDRWLKQHPEELALHIKYNNLVKPLQEIFTRHINEAKQKAILKVRNNTQITEGSMRDKIINNIQEFIRLQTHVGPSDNSVIISNNSNNTGDPHSVQSQPPLKTNQISSKNSPSIGSIDPLCSVMPNNSSLIKQPSARKSKLLNSITSDQQYEGDLINRIALAIFTLEDYNFEQQFDICFNKKNVISTLQTKLRNQDSCFIIYLINQGDYSSPYNHWVTFCVTKLNGVSHILYKNSFGQDIPSQVKTKLITYYGGRAQFKYHPRSEQIRGDGINCGPMSLKNMEIMIKGIKNNKQTFINNFQHTVFCSGTPQNLQRIKKQFQEFVYSLLTNIISEGSQLQDNNQTSQAFQKFHQASKLDPNNQIALNNMARILFEQGKTEMLDYPAQALSKFQRAIFLSNDKTRKNNVIQEKNKLLIQHPELKTFKKVQGVRSKEDLIRILKKENPNIPISQIDKLSRQVGQIRSITEFNNYGQNDIQKWVNVIKNGDKFDLKETIAMMDRVNYLATVNGQNGGHHLRDTQILSVLALLSSEEGKGRIGQIATGEGKSTIVSLLAVIKKLQNKTVDIITSSPVLAKRDAEEKRTFYEIFGFTVAHNEAIQNYITGPKVCYKADIVYGSIGNFQFDLLRHEYKGLQTRGVGQQARKFDSVIIDEVDSMLIDNGGHIAKLSGPIPGMEFFEFLLYEIWDKLQQEDHKLNRTLNIGKIFLPEDIQKHKNQPLVDAQYKQFQIEFDNLKNITNQHVNAIINTKMYSTDVKQQLRRSMLQETRKLVILGTKIEKCILPEVFLDYAKQQVVSWVENAITARYYFQENKEYILQVKNNQKTIVPVDFNNTGVLQKNTTWSEGLHQFLQIKHGLYVSAEDFTTSFISNIGYFKRYCNDGKGNIYGLTGTVGGKDAEQLLQQAYENAFDFVSIPTYKEKHFKELNTYLASDDNDWLAEIVADTIAMTTNEKAVLIICETIRDAELIKDKIQSKSKKLIIKKYFKDEDQDAVNKPMQCGEIIIATNIAGRGTDIKTSQALENNGGLHICLTYLPSNKRVEDQAFGRTSRQGNDGAGKLIINYNKTYNALEARCPRIENFEANSIKSLKDWRDEAQKQRLAKIKRDELIKINNDDILFKKFSDIYTRLKADKDQGDSTFDIKLQSIEEQWGLWFKLKKNKQNENFESFKQSIIIETDGKYKIKDDSIKNPYRWVKIGDCYMNKRDFQKAIDAYKKAINLDQDNDETDEPVAFSAHYHLAIAYIENSKATETRINNIVREVLFFIKGKSQEEMIAFKNTAKTHFEKAKKALEKYIVQIDKQLDIALKSATDLQAKILIHLESKLQLLNLFKDTIQQAINFIEGKKPDGSINLQEHNAYIAIARNNVFQLKEFGKNATEEAKKNIDKFKEVVKQTEVAELFFLSLNNLVELKYIHPINPRVAKIAKAQIIGGLALIPIGFIPGFQAAFNAAGLLISEGLCDLVVQIIKQGEESFDAQAYRNGKLISYAIGIATMGWTAIAKSMTFLNKAIKFTRKLADKLAKLSKTFGKLAELASKYVGKFANKLKASLKAVQEADKISKIKSLTQVAKNIAKEVFTDATLTVFNEKIVTELLKTALQFSKQEIQTRAKLILDRRLTVQVSFCEIKKFQLTEKAQEILKDNDIVQICREVGLGLMRHSRNNWIRAAALTIDAVDIWRKVSNCADIFCTQINQETFKEAGVRDMGKVEVINLLAPIVTNKIYELIMSLAGKVINTYVVMPALRKIHNLGNLNENENNHSNRVHQDLDTDITERIERKKNDPTLMNKKITDPETFGGIKQKASKQPKQPTTPVQNEIPKDIKLTLPRNFNNFGFEDQKTIKNGQTQKIFVQDIEGTKVITYVDGSGKSYVVQAPIKDGSPEIYRAALQLKINEPVQKYLKIGDQIVGKAFINDQFKAGGISTLIIDPSCIKSIPDKLLKQFQTALANKSSFAGDTGENGVKVINGINVNQNVYELKIHGEDRLCGQVQMVNGVSAIVFYKYLCTGFHQGGQQNQAMIKTFTRTSPPQVTYGHKNHIQENSPYTLTLPINRRGYDCVHASLFEIYERPVITDIHNRGQSIGRNSDLNNQRPGNTSNQNFKHLVGAFLDKPAINGRGVSVDDLPQKLKGFRIEKLSSASIMSDQIALNYLNTNNMSQAILFVSYKNDFGHAVVVRRDGTIYDGQFNKTYANWSKFSQDNAHDIASVRIGGIPDAEIKNSYSNLNIKCDHVNKVAQNVQALYDFFAGKRKISAITVNAMNECKINRNKIGLIGINRRLKDAIEDHIIGRLSKTEVMLNMVKDMIDSGCFDPSQMVVRAAAELQNYKGIHNKLNTENKTDSLANLQALFNRNPNICLRRCSHLDAAHTFGCHIDFGPQCANGRTLSINQNSTERDSAQSQAIRMSVETALGHTYLMPKGLNITAQKCIDKYQETLMRAFINAFINNKKPIDPNKPHRTKMQEDFERICRHNRDNIKEILNQTKSQCFNATDRSSTRQNVYKHVIATWDNEHTSNLKMLNDNDVVRFEDIADSFDDEN